MKDSVHFILDLAQSYSSSESTAIPSSATSRNSVKSPLYDGEIRSL